jgi:hypothetical protein
MANATSRARAGRRFVLAPSRRPNELIRPRERYEPFYLPVADFSHPRWIRNNATIPAANTIRLAVSGASGVARSAWWKNTLTANKLRFSLRTIISGSADSISVGFTDPAYATTASLGGSGGSGGYISPGIPGVFVTFDRWNSQVRCVTVDSGGTPTTIWTAGVSPSGTYDWTFSIKRDSANQHWLRVECPTLFALDRNELVAMTDTVYFGFVGATGGSTMNGDFSNLDMGYMRDSAPETRQKRPVNRAAIRRAAF